MNTNDCMLSEDEVDLLKAGVGVAVTIAASGVVASATIVGAKIAGEAVKSVCPPVIRIFAPALTKAAVYALGIAATGVTVSKVGSITIPKF